MVRTRGKAKRKGGEPNSQKWQDAAKAHKKLLASHINLLNLVRTQNELDGQVSSLVQQCKVETQSMLANFESVMSAMRSVERKSEPDSNAQPSQPTNAKSTSAAIPQASEPTKDKAAQTQTEELTLRHKQKRKREEPNASSEATGPPEQPIADSSELFFIDSNPTPFPELLAQSTQDGDVQHPTKRVKRGEPTLNRTSVNPAKLSATNGQSSSSPHSTTFDKIQPNTATNMDIDAPMDTEADRFAAKVAKKHQEKEAKRKKKSDKKRKRDSGSSAEMAEADAGVDGQGEKQPKGRVRKRKKARRDNFNGTEGGGAVNV